MHLTPPRPAPFAPLSAYQAVAFADRADERERIIRSLSLSGDLDEPDRESQRHARRLAECLSASVVKANATGTDHRVVESRCKHRLCPRCSLFRVRQLAAHVRNVIADTPHPRFITLTLAHTSLPLAAQLKRLRRCFSKLRRSPVWKAHVKGGIYCIEVTFNSATNTWHPHIHAILSGTFFPKAALREAWHVATGDSYIVDISAPRSKHALANYIAKYVSKGNNVEDIPDERIPELARALHGSRCTQCFGSFHGHTFTEQPDTAPTLTRHVAPISALESAPVTSSRWARSHRDAIYAHSAKHPNRRNRTEDFMRTEGPIANLRAIELIHRHWPNLGSLSEALYHNDHPPPAPEPRFNFPKLKLTHN